jgi:hypothetical protein
LQPAHQHGTQISPIGGSLPGCGTITTFADQPAKQLNT